MPITSALPGAVERRASSVSEHFGMDRRCGTARRTRVRPANGLAASSTPQADHPEAGAPMI